MNIIGIIVRSGNVRRSSELAIGSHEDKLFIDAKNWSKQTVPDWRTMSNNSIALDHFKDLNIWESYQGNGEPLGFVNLKNCREFGRIVDGRGPHDPQVVGINPCGETPNEDREPCNLAEIFISRVKSETHACEVAGILFKSCKTIANWHFSDVATEQVVKRNYRTGVSLTGVMECSWIRDSRSLNHLYRHIKAVDSVYSNELNILMSRKRTTIKPSGTLSLLPGVSPGMHAILGRHIMRTVRVPSYHPLVDICRKHGYKVEPRIGIDGSHDLSTMVVYFPVKHSKEAVLVKDMNVIEELEMQKLLQTHWADNAVSATHYYQPDDINTIKQWLKDNYDDSVKATSFLLETEHGFAQAPITPISEKQYNEEMSKVKPITKVNINEEANDCDIELECPGGICTVR